MPKTETDRTRAPADLVGPRLITPRAAVAMLRPIHGHLIACATLSAAGGAAGVFSYLSVVEIARAALASAPAAATIWTWIGVGAGCAVLRLILLGFSSHIGHHADARMLHQLRVRIVGQLGVLPLGWFRSAGSGQVKKAMTGDLEDMHNLFAHSLGEVTAAVAATVAGLGYLLSVDWRMTLVAAAVPIATVLTYQISMRSMPGHMAKLIAAERRISVAAVEYTDGIAVAKTYHAGRLLLDRFVVALREQAEAFRVWVAEVRYSSAFGRMVASEVSALAVLFGVGAVFLAQGSLSAIDLLAFLVVGVGLPTAVGPMISGAIALRGARMAAGHLEDLLDRTPLPEPARPRRPVGHRIEFDRVSFAYGTTPAVTELSLICEPGTLTALVGPSGAGKSTLAALVPRFHDVTGGAIRIGGVDVRDLATPTLLASVSLVFQEITLLRETVADNIRLGNPAASLDEVHRAAKAAQVHEVIERLPHGYDTVLDDSTGSGLSGGERQRVTIARAILADTPVVILDEATAALDPDNEAAVQDALANLVAGRTVLVIAHRLHTITAADRIVVLDQGRIVESGGHHDLLARDGSYARMWRAQNGDLG